ncbi:hypothetical protein [Streptomyces sp. NPDC006012]|uniref:hypothetical protein n=1 Tax=Streptomyces sp. NPDC006012 TaxID=3364739 RepID=UPI0036C8B993
MIYWFKVRRAHTVLPAAIVAFAILAALVQNVTIMLPSIMGRSQVALSLFIPIPLVAGLMLSLESRLSSFEMSGSRPVQVLDALLVLACAGTALLSSAFVGFLFDVPQISTAGRNACFLMGLMLCGSAFAGEAAVMFPVAWLLLVVFFGFRGPGDPYPWTIIPEPRGTLHATVGSTLLFAVGNLIQLRPSRKIS